MYCIVPVWFGLCENTVTLSQCEESRRQRSGTTRPGFWALGADPLLLQRPWSWLQALPCRKQGSSDNFIGKKQIESNFDCYHTYFS